ncbi:MAG: hypothetical protein UT05_C0003G0078 [Parcubacteria group bacterium GW2011_GWF2_38_76]|nr:MAG: hypothetical protein UT05_C0003G0078 [Parcubacteria group bacterium GW2011_GWF2_38_76]HBM46149.1 hypothetical protein [Patescibacteria group bacterium]
MIRKNTKKIIILIFVLSLPIISFAAKYTLLETFSDTQQKVVTNPMEYITSLYWYVLGLTVALSILMMIVGGLEYTLTWASESKKGEAKNRIENAIIGLLIALTAYLLLNTINPKLVAFNLNEAGISCETAPAGGVTTGITAGVNAGFVQGKATGGGGYSEF